MVKSLRCTQNPMPYPGQVLSRMGYFPAGYPQFLIQAAPGEEPFRLGSFTLHRAIGAD